MLMMVHSLLRLMTNVLDQRWLSSNEMDFSSIGTDFVVDDFRFDEMMTKILLSLFHDETMVVMNDVSFCLLFVLNVEMNGVIDYCDGFYDLNEIESDFANDFVNVSDLKQ